MPYIKEPDRVKFIKSTEMLGSLISTPGELNYVITKLILKVCPNPTYEDIAIVTGVLENVKQEYYRRVAVPYEKKKCKFNGDVY